MIMLKHSPEIILSYRSRKWIRINHWMFSVLAFNNERMLYFSLTFFGVSVTIQKKRKL